MKFNDAYGRGIIRHCTVAWFMLRTYEFLTGIGIDARRLGSDSMLDQKWLTMPRTAGTVKYSGNMGG